MPTFKAEVGDRCPFCKGRFEAGFVDGEVPAVIHTEPRCAKFDELEPDAYLRAVNVELGAWN